MESSTGYAATYFYGRHLTQFGSWEELRAWGVSEKKSWPSKPHRDNCKTDGRVLDGLWVTKDGRSMPEAACVKSKYRHELCGDVQETCGRCAKTE